jgi:hypothetical protein
MTLKRLVTCAVLALAAALPSSASAQLQVPPPGGDNVQDAIDLGTISPSPSVFAFDADTTNYTTQPELNEFDLCAGLGYGKTVWGKFRTPRTGQVDVTAAGFDGAIALLQQTRTGIAAGPCTNRLKGRIEAFRRDALPTVEKGGTYFVQVGGTEQNGATAGGPVEVAVELLKPKLVEGADAGLAVHQVKGGVRIDSVRISGPKGSAALIFTCHGTKKCGGRKTFNLKPAVTTALSPATQSVDVRGKAAGHRNLFVPAPKQAGDAPLWSARTRQVLKGRKIPNGQTVFAAIVARDQIGQLFFWKIKKGKVLPKQLGCIEPTSATIKAVGKCNGS